MDIYEVLGLLHDIYAIVRGYCIYWCNDECWCHCVRHITIYLYNVICEHVEEPGELHPEDL